MSERANKWVLFAAVLDETTDVRVSVVEPSPQGTLTVTLTSETEDIQLDLPRCVAVEMLMRLGVALGHDDDGPPAGVLQIWPGIRDTASGTVA